ncbi:MAG: EAL domain-containing protein [Rhodobiaceae bacterium]|nr:EAL domain-containing protein [Rhodobiaceae bacterium]
MYNNSSPLSADDLDQAFIQGHFAAVFQPKLSLIDGRTLGVESFIRWHHPEFGTLLPGEFLSFAGAEGRLQDLTDLMLHEAARVVSVWRSQQRHWTVSVNLSAEDVDNPYLPNHICNLFTAYAIPSDAISVDVPEAALSEDPDRRLSALAELRKRGISIALDTTGIDLLPPEKISAEYFSELKIGGTSLIKFARSVSRSRKGLIAERLEAAAANGLTVTATRVEDIETIRPLADMGFSAAQGTFFRHPDTQEGLENWSSDWLMPVLSGERPPRADTIARARADLADPDLLLLPDNDSTEIAEGDSKRLSQDTKPAEKQGDTFQVAVP